MPDWAGGQEYVGFKFTIGSKGIPKMKTVAKKEFLKLMLNREKDNG